MSSADDVIEFLRKAERAVAGIADYRVDSVAPDDARVLVDDAERFVARIVALLDEDHPIDSSV